MRFCWRGRVSRECETDIEMDILMDVEHTLVWLLVPSLPLQSGKHHSKASEYNGLDEGSE